MIHYHGGPVWPQPAAVQLWTRRHGLTSFAHPEQVGVMAELCQSFILDNGAFTYWAIVFALVTAKRRVKPP